jgi:hypothetical protein
MNRMEVWAACYSKRPVISVRERQGMFPSTYCEFPAVRIHRKYMFAIYAGNTRKEGRTSRHKMNNYYENGLSCF